MSKFHINVCPLCGNNQFNHHMDCIDYYASGETFKICQCKACGFLFTQDAPIESQIGRYYETPTYISHSDTHKGLINSIYHLVRKRMLHRKYKLITRLTGLSNGRLLDIGTGTGYFPNYMQQKGWTVEAIEKSAQARTFAKEHFALNVYDDTYLTRLTDKKFDVITLWHVLEHLEPINDVWKVFYKLLTDNGILIIAVPNSNSYDAKRYNEYWAAYDVPRHLWHFTPNTMQQFGAKHDFILAEQQPMPFDAFYISMLSEKYQKKHMPFLKGMYAGTIAWFQTLAQKENSSSMIYILRKKAHEKK